MRLHLGWFLEEMTLDPLLRSPVGLNLKRAKRAPKEPQDPLGSVARTTRIVPRASQLWLRSSLQGRTVSVDTVTR